VGQWRNKAIAPYVLAMTAIGQELALQTANLSVQSGNQIEKESICPARL
jgi:hypothetical protein